jgi:sigma-54 dependent transcriptional regulator, acetoin dehydrogenase operon transcriptional activator AcoR
MPDSHPPPSESDRSHQALVAWQRQLAGTESASELVGVEIAHSWERSLSARVDPSLPFAPLLGDADTLAQRRQLSWLELAEQQLAPHLSSIRASGHVLTLFDADGLMLSSAGAPRTLEGLYDIHFMPGAVWDERVVGTNGPGTALALHRPVHVVGAEHYCAAWQSWHCAAVPLFEPRSRRLLGALDISGHQDQVSAYAFGMACALGRLVEQSLLLRAHEQRARLLEQFHSLVARYPADTVIAADSEGCVVAAHPLPTAGVDLALLKADPRTSVVTVGDGSATLGACYVQRRAALVSASADRAPRGRQPTRLRYRLADLSGQHPLLEDARRLVRIASHNELPVLLLGESGVGKEVAAQAIHAEGPRSEAPFVAVNCGAIPKELVESELFGYVAGAFSGAQRQGGRGKLEAARGGTLFLDEVGELPLATQAVLLRVLSEQQFTPVGGTEPRTTDARVIAATNRDLQAEVAAGRFRADLFYRLNVIAIALPPLRLRQVDLPDLCARMLTRAAEETGRRVELHPDVMAAFARYAWPGNVRELENLLKRLSAVSRAELVQLSDLPAELAREAPSTPTNAAPSREDPHKLQLLSVIAAAQTMAEAAKVLGVTRSTLYRQLERFGLRPGRGVRQA